MSFDGIQTNMWDPNSLDGLGNSDTLSGDISIAISVNNAYIEANYLRLDTSNDPITGTLTANGSLSVSGTSWLGYVKSSSQITAQTLQSNGTIGGQSIYCDTAEFGIDATSLGLKVYNQLS